MFRLAVLLLGLSLSPGLLGHPAHQRFKRASKEVILKYQESKALEPTGELNEETKQRLCAGCSDEEIEEKLDFFATAELWQMQKLTYYLEDEMDDITKEELRRGVSKAFDVWSKVIPFDFSEVESPDNAHFKVGFRQGKHDDDSMAFDGPGNTAAHAINSWSSDPTARRSLLHYDKDENWVVEDTEKLRPLDGKFADIVQMGIHELGHAFGLDHSHDERSVMAPTVPLLQFKEDGSLIQMELQPEDIRRIQTLYGARKNTDGNEVTEPTNGGDGEKEETTVSVTTEKTEEGNGGDKDGNGIDEPEATSSAPSTTDKPTDDEGGKEDEGNGLETTAVPSTTEQPTDKGDDGDKEGDATEEPKKNDDDQPKEEVPCRAEMGDWTSDSKSEPPKEYLDCLKKLKGEEGTEKPTDGEHGGDKDGGDNGNKDNCPKGFTYFDKTNKCYKILTGYGTVQMANKACGDFHEGYTLSSVRNQAENNFIADLNKDGATFIGLVSVKENNVDFEWLDGSKSEYTNWLPDEPNSRWGPEYCVLLYGKSSGPEFYAKWNNEDCDLDHQYVCASPPL